MAVWTTPSARATTVGAGLVARTAARVCSSHLRTTSSLGEGPYWLKEKVGPGPLGLAGLGGGGSVPAALADGVRPIASVRVRIRVMKRARGVLMVLAIRSSWTNRHD